MPTQTPRLCGDGVSETALSALAGASGWPLGRSADALAVLDTAADAEQPVVLVVAGLDEERLERALRPPVAACIEVAPEGWDGRLPTDFAAEATGLRLSLLTSSAYVLEPARAFCDALEARGALSKAVRGVAELAVHEGMVNALVHGNLEIGSLSKDNLDDFILFCQTIENRLADPAFGSRRINLIARWDEAATEIAIEDQGPGFDVNAAAGQTDPTRKSGRGLFLIRDLAQSVSIENGGRRLVMRFAR